MGADSRRDTPQSAPSPQPRGVFIFHPARFRLPLVSGLGSQPAVAEAPRPPTSLAGRIFRLNQLLEVPKASFGHPLSDYSSQ